VLVVMMEASLLLLRLRMEGLLLHLCLVGPEIAAAPVEHIVRQ